MFDVQSVHCFGQFNQKKNYIFVIKDEVSYEVSGFSVQISVGIEVSGKNLTPDT